MRTTTDPSNWRFHFTVTDLGRYLGKSPVTLRGWERAGLVSIPRDGSGDRRLGTQDIRAIATTAFARKRINQRRLDLVAATMTLIESIERENEK